MNEVLELTYNKKVWKEKLSNTKDLVEKAEQVLDAIEVMEKRRSNSIATAMEWSTFQSIVDRYTKRAAIQRAAIIRLRAYFNNLIMEIQL